MEAAEEVLRGRGIEADAAAFAQRDDRPYDADLAALWERAEYAAYKAGYQNWQRWGGTATLELVVTKQEVLEQ